mmetsp:Transcript_7384/g.21004  ORF Transcript_7384/g.21004 Transcript_7384/m.21004 type:complete len:256 (-) Transcript_7384:508-1275(-)
MHEVVLGHVPHSQPRGSGAAGGPPAAGGDPSGPGPFVQRHEAAGGDEFVAQRAGGRAARRDAPDHGLEQGRLACAARPQYGVQRPSSEREAHLVQDLPSVPPGQVHGIVADLAVHACDRGGERGLLRHEQHLLPLDAQADGQCAEQLLLALHSVGLLHLPVVQAPQPEPVRHDGEDERAEAGEDAENGSERDFWAERPFRTRAQRRALLRLGHHAGAVVARGAHHGRRRIRAVVPPIALQEGRPGELGAVVAFDA